MKRIVGPGIVFVAALFIRCDGENGVTGPIEPPGRQHDIPWPSLADSPWPMGHHDPQSTGRSPHVAGPEGKLVWKKEGLAVFSGVILDTDGTLYYESADSAMVWALYAVNSDGSLKWKSSLYTPPPPTMGTKNFTYPVLSASGTIYVISRDGNLYAINRDGSRKWALSADAPARTRGLTIGLDGTLYFVSGSGTLQAVNAGGSLKWQKFVDEGFWSGETGPPIVFSPDGEVLYVGGKTKGLYAIGLDGGIMWFTERVTNDFVSMRLVDSQGNIYAANGDTTVISFTPDGHVRWTFHEVRFPLGITMDYDGNVYFWSAGGLVSLTYDGALRWTYPIPDPFGGELVCDQEGTIYFGAGFQSGLFYAVRRDGSLKWTVSLPAALDFSPTPAIAIDGSVYAPAGSTTQGEGWGLYSFR